MRSSALRTVLLVKAIEDADPDGVLLPHAERELATREAKLPRADRGGVDEASDAPGLPARAQRFLARRARTLFDRLALRYPGLHAADAAARGSVWLAPLALLASLASGIGMAQLDGSQRINILAYPLLGIVAWNFLVYAILVIAWIRRVGARSPGAAGGPGRALARLAFRLGRGMSAGNGVPQTLSGAVSSFGEAWWNASGHLLTMQVKRILHLCAAALAAGLVIGLYARGIALEYLAGWESTFLDHHAVHRLISLFLGPAAAATDLALPSADQLAAIRWVDGRQGGENAAPWVHLFAAAAALYVVIPRLLLAAAATLTLWRLRLRSTLPPPLLAYYQQLAGGGDALGLTGASVFPYSFEPSAEARQSLERLLVQGFGSALTVTFAAPIPYGEEEAAAHQFSARSSGKDLVVILFSLAATPEEENHGALIEAARGVPFLLVVVDESGFRARFGSDPGYAQRLDERRAAWHALGDSRAIRVAFFHPAPEADRRQQAAQARALVEALGSRAT